MISVCEITRRLRLPKGISWGKDFSVILQAEMENESERSIRLYFQVLRQGEKYVRCEADSLVDMHELPDPAGNKQQWEKVRQLVRDDVYSPNEAWTYVALRNASRKWKFSVEESMDDPLIPWTASFSINIPGHFPIEARIDFVEVTEILDFPYGLKK